MGHGGGKENVQRSEIGRVQSEQRRAQGYARQPQRAKEHKALTTQTAFFKAGPGAASAPGRGPPGISYCPKSAARGNCGPLARLARRALFGRLRRFVSARSGCRHAGRVSSDAGDRGVRIRPARGPRRARPAGISCRGAPAPRFHGLWFRFAVRLCGFLRAPDSRRSARVCEAGSLFHGAPPRSRRGVCKIADSNLRAACCAPAHCRLAHLA